MEFENLGTFPEKILKGKKLRRQMIKVKLINKVKYKSKTSI